MAHYQIAVIVPQVHSVSFTATEPYTDISGLAAIDAAAQRHAHNSISWFNECLLRLIQQSKFNLLYGCVCKNNCL